jgi:hypothetical protein
LRVQRIVLASEGMREIRIAFPVCGRVAIREARVFGSIAAGESPMGQRVGPGVANLGGRLGAAGEIAFPLFRIAPSAARIPVPGLDLKIGVLAIGDRLPTGVKNLFENGICEHVIRGSRSEPVDTRAESANRAERIHGVRRIGVYDDVLGHGGRRERQQRGQAAVDYFRLRHSDS